MDHVALQAKLQPERLAVVDLPTERRWSYAEFDKSIAKCACLLKDTYDLQVGERIATVAKNTAELIMLHLACARLGLIYVPLNWRLSPPELELLIHDSAPTLLIGDEMLDPVSSHLPRKSIEEIRIEIEAATPLPHSPIDRNKPSLILYTSGTSGKPKGALLSEKNMDQTAINFTILGRVNHLSVFLCDSPMFHIIGLISNIRPTFFSGAAVLISEGFNAERTLNRLADPKLGVTHYFGVPQMAQMFRNEPSFDPAKLRHLTAIVTGGAPHPEPSIMAWINDGISIVNGFGMSETGTTFGMPIERDAIAKKPGSVGVATPGIQARIINARGHDVECGHAGELILKGDNVTEGYWQNPEATKAAFTKDGWFKTGDVATKDEDGFYYLVDRKKDMFISGGENVYPAEVEAALDGMPGIVEMAVIGVPDDKWGEVGHLAIVCKKAHDITFDAVLEYLAPKLARYKLPKHFTTLDTLPRTGSGKIQKHILKEVLHIDA